MLHYIPSFNLFILKRPFHHINSRGASWLSSESKLRVAVLVNNRYRRVISDGETQRPWALHSTAARGLASRPSKWNTRHMGGPNIDISDLTTDERLALIEELWDSLAASPGELSLTDEQRTELDRRLDEMDRDDRLGIPWDEAISEIRGRK